MGDFDILVIGAGLGGLAFARFYLDTHPHSSLVMVEADKSIGGVWSVDRSFDGFWLQTPHRMAGFSDIPFEIPEGAPSYNDMCEAKHVTSYLERYVDSNVYNGKSLRSRIVLGHKIISTTKQDGVWTTLAQASNGTRRDFTSKRLVVATGHSSIPHVPIIPGLTEFEGPVVHHVEFGKKSQTLFHDSKCERITVIGGGKSASDLALTSAKAGKIVDWIIRASGEGPAIFFPQHSKDPRYLSATEQNATRKNSFYSPSSFTPDTWLRKIFHESNYGKSKVAKRTETVDNFCRDLGRFHDREGALPGFENMEPSSSSFWCTGPVGSIQHEDFYEFFAKNVHIHREDIVCVSKNSIHLSSGKVIPSNAILCGTGWNYDYPFLAKEDTRKLGLPYPKESQTPAEAVLWDELLEEADNLVLKRYPILEVPPPYRQSKRASLTTARLYNGIAPLEDSSVLFLGHVNISNSFRTSEAQAIWATAYLDGVVKLPPPEVARKQVAYMNAFSRRRYPSLGITGDSVFFELVPYTDALLREVGLTSHLNKGRQGNWLLPCLASDLKDMPNEYQRLRAAQLTS